MSVYSKIPLSGSTDGRGIKVAASAIGSGTTIHAAQASATTVDNVTLFCRNSDTVQRVLTIGWGGTTAPDDLIKTTIQPDDGLTLVVADLVIRNSLTVVAAGDAGNVLVLWGYVNRIT